MRLRSCLAAVVAVLAMTACQQPTGAAAHRAEHQAAGRLPRVTKVLVFVVENHSRDEMRSQMPHVAGLGKRYAFATRYRAVTHPSLPNYLAIAGGSTFGVTDDDSPGGHVIHGRSVFGQAIAAGKTAKVYAEGMPGSCALQPGGTRYAVKHNPWAYFADERAPCNAYDVPLGALSADAESGSLPAAGMVVPDLCHDAHDCDLAGADVWLRDMVGAVLAGPDFASGHLAVVITADEDDRSQGNLVLTTVLHPSQQGHVVRTPLTHYSLTRFYDQVLRVPALRRASTAPDLAKAFGLPVPRLRTR